ISPQIFWSRRRKLVCGASHGVKLVTHCHSSPSASFLFSDRYRLATYSFRRKSKHGKNLERANSHTVPGGEGIGGGIAADMRFRQTTRCRMKKISQPANATRPPGIVTSMNQPITPSE